jgi:hypothetical protein
MFTCTNGRESKGLSKSTFLAINAKGGEGISPKQKDRTTTNFKFKVFKRSFQNWYLNVIDLVEISIYKNW